MLRGVGGGRQLWIECSDGGGDGSLHISVSPSIHPSINQSIHPWLPPYLRLSIHPSIVCSVQVQAAAANFCCGCSHNPPEESIICKEVNLFSVGSALNTRAIYKEFFNCFLHRIARARRRNRRVSRSMGCLLEQISSINCSESPNRMSQIPHKSM